MNAVLEWVAAAAIDLGGSWRWWVLWWAQDVIQALAGNRRGWPAIEFQVAENHGNARCFPCQELYDVFLLEAAAPFCWPLAVFGAAPSLARHLRDRRNLLRADAEGMEHDNLGRISMHQQGADREAAAKDRRHAE